MTNNKEKIKKNKRFNLVDALILVVAVMVITAVIAFVVALVTDADAIFGNNKNAKPNTQYTVQISELDTELYSIVKGADNVAGCPSLQKGDKVYDVQSGKEIGVITAVTYSDCVRSTGKYDENNNLLYAPYPGFVDLFITIEVYCDPDENGYNVNGNEIRIGKQLDFRTYGFCANGSVVDIGELSPAAESGK